MRKLHEIFNAAKLHHCYWGGETGYMCHAIDSAVEAFAISEEEAAEARDFVQSLLEHFSPCNTSLAGALKRHLVVEVRVAVSWEQVAWWVWEAVIDKLTLEDK